MQSEGMAIDIAQSVHEAAAEMTYLQGTSRSDLSNPADCRSAYPSSGADPPVPGTHAAMDIDRMAIHEVQSERYFVQVDPTLIYRCRGLVLE